MSGPRNSPSCGVCGRKLVKNGTTSAGRTRWRCQQCGASPPQRPKQTPLDDQKIGPAAYDTGFNWEDGNGIQHGWGGRNG